MSSWLVLAHGVGARGDLPLPVWQVIWGAAIALVASFAGLGLLWTKPKLGEVTGGRPLLAADNAIVGTGEAVLRAVFLVMWAVVLSASWLGSENVAINISPVAVYVIFWVGLQGASALFGDFWARLSPFDTIVRLAGQDATVDSTLGVVGMGAVASIFAFVWLELAYHSPAEPRVVAVFLTVYSAVMIVGGLRNGRGWLRANDGFAVLSTLIGAMAPLFVRQDGGLGLRLPLVGLSRVHPNRLAMVFVLVVLGSTTFDGAGGLDFWSDLVADRSGWNLTFVSSLGLLATVLFVTAVYLVAAAASAGLTMRQRDEVAETFSTSLVPIVLAYSIAHYFSLFVFEGQNFIIQASDPYGKGWDLFGTQDNSVDFLLVSTAAIAWVQVGSIVLGHIAGVTVAHDRAVERHDHEVAIRSQYPMLAAMVCFTVIGLILLLNA